MRYLILISLLLSIGCAAPKTVIQVDPAFELYYQSFLTEARNEHYPLADTVSIIIQFGDTRADNIEAIGDCTKTNNDTPLVKIDAVYWKDLDTRYKEQLIFHELGHCILGRVHTSEMMGKLPKSYMYPQLFTSNASYRAGYVHELFHP